MKKLTVVVIFGGESSEHEVSLKSASSVIENLDMEKYEVVKVGITRDGKWLKYYGDIDKIKGNTWFSDENCTEIIIPPSKGNRHIIEVTRSGLIYTDIDIAFPILHGKNGEDGSIQGLFEIAGIPYVGCDIPTSAICMDKDYAHILVESAGLSVPKSLLVQNSTTDEEINLFAENVKYPIYVKPSREGSSIGITKANNKSELFDGIREALNLDSRVVLEQNIDGFEVGCAILGNTELIVGTIDEIEISTGFFDFTEKYTLTNSKIHLPARIDNELNDEIKETAKKIYKVLGCTGLARIDMFIDKNKRIIFNEVNTLPGFTKGSRFPNMLLDSGIEYKEILDRLIKLGLERNS